VLNFPSIFGMIEPDDLTSKAHEFSLKASVVCDYDGGTVQNVGNVRCGLNASLHHLRQTPERSERRVARVMVPEDGPTQPGPLLHEFHEGPHVVSECALCFWDTRKGRIPVERDDYRLWITAAPSPGVPVIKSRASDNDSRFEWVTAQPTVSDILVRAQEHRRVLVAPATGVVGIRTTSEIDILLSCPVLDVDELVVRVSLDICVPCNQVYPITLSAWAIPPVGAPQMFRK
jgi:hypothetical protein